MYKRISIYIFLIVNFLISENITGYELAKLIDEKPQPKSSKSEISMTLNNLKRNKSKTKEMISIAKNNGDKMLMFFKSPKRDKAVGFLKIENEVSDKLSLFIPKLKKIRRISSSNQSDSFMGSDLSFEDMLSRNLDDYDYNIISETDDLYQLESICKDKDSEYLKHISWILKDQLLIQKEYSYDQNNELLKEKLFKHILISDYQLVSEISVTNVKKKHSTILKINTLEVDGDINDDTFTEINLKRFEKFNQ